MAASGSAWIKPKKRQGLRPATITEAPHPLSVRPGQRYFPLDSRARARVTLRVVRAGGGRCEARREDASARIVRLSNERLLTADENGVGVHYRFVGYASRAGYSTHACVVARDGAWARLICPEWHPAAPITVAAAGLPPASRAVGAWVACKGDLGATAPARTDLRDFAAPTAGFDPAGLHPVVPGDADVPEPEPDTQDVVLFVSGADAAEAMTSERGVYLTGHAPPTGRDHRAYLCVDGVITGWRAVAAVHPLPNGTRILLRGPWNAVAVSVRPVVPAASMAGGRLGRQLWTTRSWAIEDE